MKFRIKSIFALFLILAMAVTLIACGNDTVTVTFNTDGGSAISSIKVNKGSKLTNVPTPTKATFDFIGWYKEESKSNEWKMEVDVVDNDLTLYAKWQASVPPVTEFTVTFNPGAGDMTSTSVNAPNNTLISQPTAQLDGHEIEGWYKEAAFTTKWNFATDKVTANITLYAKWKEVVALEGTAITSQQALYDLLTGATLHAEGDKFYLSADLNFASFTWAPKEGEPAVFSGVFDGNGKKIYNLDIETAGIGGIFAKISGATIKNLTIDNVHVVSTKERAGILVGQTEKSQTSPNTHANLIENIVIKNSSVSANNDGGAGAVMGQNKWVLDLNHITVLNTKVHNQAKNAGGLLGQLDGNDLRVKNVLVDAVVTSDSENAGGLLGELKNLKPGDATTPSDLYVDGAVVRASVSSMRYSGGLVGKNAVNTADEAVAKGNLKHVIAMVNVWNTGGNKNDVGYLLSRPAALTTPAEHVYVVGSALGHLTPKGNVAATQNLKRLSDITSAHYTGFDSNVWTLSVANLPSLNSNIVEVGHLVTMMIDETTVYQYVKTGEIPALYVPVKTGLAFENWFTDADFTTLYNNEVISQDITLYAKFEVKRAVSFITNGGTTVSTIQVSNGEKVTLPAAPSKENHTFTGWFTDEDLTVAFDANTEITADTTLYAKWTENEKVLVSFDTDGGSEIESKAVYVGQALDLPISPTKDGYTFIGWFTDDQRTLEFDKDTIISEAFVLYAKFINNDDLVKHIISFDTNEGSIVADVQVIDGQTLTLPANPTKSGFTFLGWFTDVETAIAFDSDTIITKAITLYAKWIATNSTKYILTADMNTNNKFTILGDGFKTPEAATTYTHNNVEYTSGVRMDSKGKISFTSAGKVTLRIAVSARQTVDLDIANIFIDGKSYDLKDYFIANSKVAFIEIVIEEAKTIDITRNEQKGKKATAVFYLEIEEFNS